MSVMVGELKVSKKAVKIEVNVQILHIFPQTDRPAHDWPFF